MIGAVTPDKMNYWTTYVQCKHEGMENYARAIVESLFDAYGVHVIMSTFGFVFVNDSTGVIYLKCTAMEDCGIGSNINTNMFVHAI
jgi:hypothetical protein